MLLSTNPKPEREVSVSITNTSHCYNAKAIQYGNASIKILRPSTVL